MTDRARVDPGDVEAGRQDATGGTSPRQALDAAAGRHAPPPTGRATGSPGDEPVAGVPRSARRLAAVLLLALAVPGVIGFDLWPLTGWRLFSLSRRETQTIWVLEAADRAGATREVSLEDLPLAYRHAEWPMAELREAPASRRDEVCQALLAAIVDLHPETVELHLLQDEQRLVHQDGEWVVTHDPEVFHTCRA